MKYWLLALALLLQDPLTIPQRLDRITEEVTAIRLLLNPPEPEPTETIYIVPAGESLQDKLDWVPEGAIVELEQGAVYPGPVTIRKPLTLRKQGNDMEVGARPVVTCPVQQQAIFIEAPNVTLRGLEVKGNCNDAIWLKPTALNTLIEHSYIHGEGSAKNGITLHGSAIIRHNLIDDIYRVGQESHGIVSWEGGPYVIEHNSIAAASINVLIGGSDPSSEAVHPHDLTFRNNYLWKKLDWRGKGYAVKNLFELKILKGGTIADNTMEYSWVDGQLGWGLVISVRNQSGTAPWSIIENVTIERNTIRHVAGGISWLGQDDRAGYPSQRTRNVTIQQNLFEDINKTTWGTNGRAIQLNQGSENLILDANIVRGGDVHSFLFFAGPTTIPHVGLQVTTHTATEGRWGIFGDNNTGFGVNPLKVYAPGYTWTAVTLERNPASFQPQTYPSGTVIVTP